MSQSQAYRGYRGDPARKEEHPRRSAQANIERKRRTYGWMGVQAGAITQQEPARFNASLERAAEMDAYYANFNMVKVVERKAWSRKPVRLCVNSAPAGARSPP
jgi:hypothetical protein